MGDLRTGRATGLVNAIVLGASLGVGPVLAEDPPKYWAVTGVEEGDTLHMRDMPHGDSKILADIPPRAHGLKDFGCIVPQPSFDRWVDMTPAERANAKLAWCRVEYKGNQGWVAARFLKPDAAGK
jgi:hypothetical protein